MCNPFFPPERVKCVSHRILFLLTFVLFLGCSWAIGLLGDSDDEPEVEQRVGRRSLRGGARPKGLSLRSFSILSAFREHPKKD
jgi:hypothetical protein